MNLHNWMESPLISSQCVILRIQKIHLAIQVKIFLSLNSCCDNKVETLYLVDVTELLSNIVTYLYY